MVNFADKDLQTSLCMQLETFVISYDCDQGQPKETPTCIQLEKRVAVIIWYLATGWCSFSYATLPLLLDYVV